MKISVKFQGLENVKRSLNNACLNAEHEVAQQIMSDTRRFVPMSGNGGGASLDARTRVEGNKIIYPGPYAQYLYHGKVMETLDGHGPAHYIDKGGNEVIKFPFGSKLRATDRNLVFTKKFHEDAQSHWMEASKAQNMDKWERVAEKAVKKNL